MDRNADHKSTNGRTQRIIATLFSLAVLAEVAGRRLWCVRFFVLFVLNIAESVARDYVCGLAEDAGLDALAQELDALCDCPTDDGASEAVRLALSLRMLAMALTQLAELGLVCDDEEVWRRRIWLEDHARSVQGARARLAAHGHQARYVGKRSPQGMARDFGWRVRTTRLNEAACA